LNDKDVTPEDMDAGPMSSVMGEQPNPNGGFQQQPFSQAPAAYGQPAVATSYPNARALYAFVGQDGSELSFSEGEIISIVAQVSCRTWSCF
jgi:hypothetical protein